MEITTVGLDLAKHVFQVHAVSNTGEVVVRRLRRAQVIPFFSKLPPCLVGMEACGTSHYWARELTAVGHEVRLMPPAYVKPYVKRGKTDALAFVRRVVAGEAQDIRNGLRVAPAIGHSDAWSGDRSLPCAEAVTLPQPLPVARGRPALAGGRRTRIQTG